MQLAILVNMLKTLQSGVFSFWGIIYLAIFAYSCYALYTLWTSSASSIGKVIWSLAIFFFPFLGATAYFFLGKSK
jgi:hypothetical protein